MQPLLIYICVNMCIYLSVCVSVCACIPTEFGDFSYKHMCLNKGVFKLMYAPQCQPENSRDTFFWKRSPSISVWWQLLLQLLQYDRFFILKVQGQTVTPFSPTVSSAFPLFFILFYFSKMRLCQLKSYSRYQTDSCNITSFCSPSQQQWHFSVQQEVS